MFFYMQYLVKKISLYHLIKIPSWFQFYTFLFSDFILLQFPWTYLKSLVVFKRVQNLYKFFLLAAVFQAKVCCTIISSEHITGLAGCNWKKNHPCCWWLLLHGGKVVVEFWSVAARRRGGCFIVCSSLSHEWEYHMLAERLLWTDSCKCYWQVHLWVLMVFICKKKKKKKSWKIVALFHGIGAVVLIEAC